MSAGVVAHLFWRGKIFLILRDKLKVDEPTFVDPDCWDSLTETMEPEDGGDFDFAMRRGCVEEISLVPARLEYLGKTRAGHGFFFGTFTDVEVQSIVLDKNEGQKYCFFNLEDLDDLPLGGAIKWHLEAYPRAFASMSIGISPSPIQLGLTGIRRFVLSNK